MFERDAHVGIPTPIRQDIKIRDAREAPARKDDPQNMLDRLKVLESMLDSMVRAASFNFTSLQFPDSWLGHLPFAAWLIRELSPKIFVELGTHSGNSYFGFCQTVAEAHLTTRCYAVDTWKGDAHAGHYGEEVFAKVSAHNQQHYAAFSRLLRTTFEEAATCFSDESVDLLHIDGLHTYEAVRHDFETWLPRLRPGAVVLLHDTNVRERDFGVWKFWEELRAQYSHSLEFSHSHGLGVLQLDNAPPGKELGWLGSASDEKERLVEYFTALGARQLERYESMELKRRIAGLDQVLEERNYSIAELDRRTADRDRVIAGLNIQTADRDHTIVDLNRQITERDRCAGERNAQIASLEQALADLRSSHSWRVTRPLREFRRWVAAPRSRTRVYITRSSSFIRAKYTKYQALSLRRAAHGKVIEQVAPSTLELADLARIRECSPLFDAQWYLQTYPDVRDAGVDAMEHFATVGWREGRSPHPLFDAQWYLNTNPDVRAAGMNPLLHYVQFGAAELRNPNPDFDARFYVAKHPEAAENPLKYHVQFGVLTGLQTRLRPVNIADYLPTGRGKIVPLTQVPVDIVVPVYRGQDSARRCLESVLSDTDRPPGTIRVIDDCSPEPDLSAWLASLAATGRIELTRNSSNLGFVATVNGGMTAAGRHDVLLLNSDAEVPPGFLRRLAAHAYSSPKIASVTPFSNNAGEMCSYPTATGGPMPSGYSLIAIDSACQTANGLRTVEIPTGRGFCMYIRRDCLDEIGLFDVEAFGRGYGEETDFCLRAIAAGWRHLLACDTFVYHTGEVSFGKDAPERATSWNTLVNRYPQLPDLLARQIATSPEVSAKFAATAALFSGSALPTVLMLSHHFNERTVKHVDERVSQTTASANVLLLSSREAELELLVPSLPGHPSLRLPNNAVADVAAFLRACSVGRVHVQHWIDLGTDLHELVDQLDVPFDLTVHDYFAV